MSDTLTSVFGTSSGGILGGLQSSLSTKGGLSALQAGSTGLSIMSKLQQGDDTAESYMEKAADYEAARINAGITAQGQADTAIIGSDATIQQIIQSATATGIGSKLEGETSAVRGGASAFITALNQKAQAMQRASGYNIGAMQTEAQAGSAFVDDQTQRTSLRTDLAKKLSQISAASANSGFDPSVGQAAGGRLEHATDQAAGLSQAQAMMRYGAGLASARALRAAGTEAGAEGDIQAGLTTQLADISGRRDITEGQLAARLAGRTAGIAAPVERLRGDLSADLATKAGAVAQAQDLLSEVNAMIGGKEAKSAAGAQALMAGLGGLFSILKL